MNADRIDELTKRLDGIVAEIDKALTHRVTIESHDGYDDGDSYDDGSNPSLDASDDSDSYDGDFDDEEDDGDDLDKMRKATINAAQLTNDRSARPGALPTSDHPQRRHKFEALVEKIKNEQGIPASQAMALARQQYPEIYAHYVGSAGSYFKAAPGSFERLVNEELAKGCSTFEQAAQRTVQKFGYRALDHRDMSKREATSVLAEGELIAKAQAIWEDDPAISRTAALRMARLASPRLYRALTR
jgi:hypothetical protein